MPYRKYKGSDKYHFRYYHLSNNPPFLVVLVLEEKKENRKVLISGFNMTPSEKLFKKKPGKFVKLKKYPRIKKDLKVLIRDQSHILFRRAKVSSSGCNHLLIVTSGGHY